MGSPAKMTGPNHLPVNVNPECTWLKPINQKLLISGLAK